ncbi:MAG: LysR family transcriptional regulator [Aeromonas sp.]
MPTEDEAMPAPITPLAAWRPKSTLEQWRMLLAVVDFGGYAQAAQALGKSQSSLNHAIAKLQESLGVGLLIVRGRKAELTDAGWRLLPRARALAAQLAALEDYGHDCAAQWESQLSLYVTPALDLAPLAQALSCFYPARRRTALRLITRTTAPTPLPAQAFWLGPAAEGHGVYVGDVALWPVIRHASMPDRREQGQESKDNAADTANALDEAAALAALTQAGSVLLELAEPSALPIAGDTPDANAPWQVSSYAQMLSLLLAGIGYGWLPATLAAPYLAEQRLQRLPLSARHQAVYLCHGQNVRMGPAAQHLRVCLLTAYPAAGT